MVNRPMTNEELRTQLQMLADTYGVTLDVAYDQFEAVLSSVIEEYVAAEVRRARLGSEPPPGTAPRRTSILNLTDPSLNRGRGA